MSIYIPKELRREAHTKQGLSGFDVILIFLTGVFSWVFRGITYGFLQYVFPFFITGVVFWLVLPSKDDYRAKNYQVMLHALRFRKRVYVAESENRERIRLKKGEKS